MSQAQLRCPHCSQMFMTPAGMEGQVVACPHCQGQLRVPGTPAAAPPARPAAPMARPTAPATPPAPAPPTPPGAPAAAPAARPAPPQPAGGQSAFAQTPQLQSPQFPTPTPTINDPSRGSTSQVAMRRRKSSNTGVMVGAGLATVAFVGGAIAIIAAISGGSNYSKAEKKAEEALDQVRKLASVLESVKDKQSAAAAAPQIDAIVTKIRSLHNESMKIKISKADNRKLTQKMQSEMKKIQPRMMQAAMQAGMNSQGDPAFMSAITRLEQLESLGR